jgi:cleavage stimulation factor subunit 3
MRSFVALDVFQAKKFLADLSPSYMTARTALRDLRRLITALTPPQSQDSASLSLPVRPTWASDNDRALAVTWKAYLKWEEGNPLDIEDPSILHSRISGAYKKAVSRMRFYPEMWCVVDQYDYRTCH